MSDFKRQWPTWLLFVSLIVLGILTWRAAKMCDGDLVRGAVWWVCVEK